MNRDKVIEMVAELQDLYCKWCPLDCEGLTNEERHGCLASGGFVDDLEEAGYRKLSDDQSVEVVYVGNDHYQTTSKVKDDSYEGKSHWHCYIPSVITEKIGIAKERGRLFRLSLREEPTGRE